MIKNFNCIIKLEKWTMYCDMPTIKANCSVCRFDVKTDQRNFMMNKLWRLAHFCICRKHFKKVFLWEAASKVTRKGPYLLVSPLLYDSPFP